MSKLLRQVLFLSFALGSPWARAQAQDTRTINNFDKSWRFIKGDVPGAEATTYNDAEWRLLDVPHDWSIEGPYDRNNTTGRGGGYLPGGIGWYRKAFSLDATNAHDLVFIEFDGIMANSDVWINGFHLGKRPNGYASLSYNLTAHLEFGKGKNNVIAVRADNTTQPASRWYTGAGIYRHVRLLITKPVHISHWGTFISSKDVSANKATLQVATSVSNATAANTTVIVETNIISPDGKTVALESSAPQDITAKAERLVAKSIEIKNPTLWNINDPQLYEAVTKVWIGKKQVDEQVTEFGIREARFDAATGFWLNGKNIKIKGACLHQDGGAIGAAVPEAVWKRRLSLLKEAGVNAIRTAHNAPSPDFLDLCDQMGFLVMDETFDTWNAAKSNAEKGYNLYFNDWWERDTRDMIMRDRNHPSIVIYSVGNEIHDNLNDSAGFHKYAMQQDLIHTLDGTRPVTMALFRPALSHVYDNDFANRMDVVGQNYRENELVAAHETNPQRKVVGTENGFQLSAWLALRDKPYMAGQFLWVGFDYLGESDWPAVVNGQGLYDRTGGARAVAWQRKSWWSDDPMVYVMRKQGNAGAGEWISDWSPTDIDTYDEAQLQVFSNCDEVELFLNGRSLGAKARPDDNASPRTWTTTFQRGTLKAVGRNQGQVVAEQELRTAGTPAKILLVADKPTIDNSWDDLVYVRAIITDENGNPCLNADDKIRFGVEGAGVIVAVDNADLTSSEPYQAKERWAYKGTCVALIKANADRGKIIITATGGQLRAATISLTVKELIKQ